MLVTTKCLISNNVLKQLKNGIFNSTNLHFFSSDALLLVVSKIACGVKVDRSPEVAGASFSDYVEAKKNKEHRVPAASGIDIP